MAHHYDIHSCYIRNIHSDYQFSIYNWYLPSRQSFQHVHESDLNQLLIYARPPCYTLLFYLLGPSRCDRNRPPWSQVVCELLPLFPIVPLCPPLQNPNPFSDFPEPNVHLIKARLNPLPSIQNSSGP